MFAQSPFVLIQDLSLLIKFIIHWSIFNYILLYLSRIRHIWLIFRLVWILFSEELRTIV